MSVRSLRRPLGVLAVGVTALVTAATQAHEQGDVEVFWFTGAGSGLSAGHLGSYGVYSGSATYSGMRS